MRATLLLFFAAALLLGGCLPDQRLYLSTDSPPAGKSLVYFYRPLGPADDGPDPAIAAGGKEILYRLPRQSFWVYPIEPGTYTFSAAAPYTGSETVTIENGEEGEIYFIELGYEYGAPDRFTLYLAGRGEDSEPKELEGCFRLETKRL
ncbi:MAG: hypothetical protein AB1568_12500 [Thermodesulfobacteriota bacterium]